MELLNNLNPVQRRAVKATGGPVLILAGAGSGKTRVLTYRIAYLLKTRKAKPWEILAVTFTNKAAGEMRDRVEKLIDVQIRQMWIGTFHSIFARILRNEVDVIGYDRNFTIYDSIDQLSLVKKVMKSLGISAQQFSPKGIVSRISGAKNSLCSPEDYQMIADDIFEENASKVYFEYQKKLKKNNSMDFDDLITKPIELFEKFPNVLEKYQDRFRYISIDEYQDTNRAQYILMKLLAKKHENICSVGDDDQSIYKFRGADIRNILEFEKDYPGCNVFRLEQNYRSTQTILDVAGSVVSQNKSRKTKNLWTDRGNGDKVTLLELQNEKEEAQKCVEMIQADMIKNKRDFNDFVILYRTNAQSRSVEDALRRFGIPYTIVGGTRFYDRKEIKDVLAYLNLVVNPMNSVGLVRIINVPSRKIGDTSLNYVEEYAMKYQLSIFEALSQCESIDKLQPRAKKQIVEFVDMIKKYNYLKDEISVSELTRALIEETKILEIYKKEGTPEAQNRRDNIMELMNAVTEYSENNDDPTLENFLEEVSLISDIDQWNDERNYVTLMTLHSAKGLEFPVVFIVGLEEGLFPISLSKYSEEDLEEERRLFYVGVTRAKDKVYLSWAVQRFQFGESNFNFCSQFIDEIPVEFLEIQKFKSSFKKYRTKSTKSRSKINTHKRFSAKQSVDEDTFGVGKWVQHATFGIGKIIASDGFDDEMKLSVRFNGNNVKRLMVKYAKLKILKGVL